MLFRSGGHGHEKCLLFIGAGFLYLPYPAFCKLQEFIAITAPADFEAAARITGFLKEHKDRFKPGALVTDVCGVKTAVMEAAACLPDGVDFIGCHPMAGKEVSGIANAEGGLFRNTHFIVTPGPRSTPEHLALLRRMAAHCRFGDVIETTPEIGRAHV